MVANHESTQHTAREARDHPALEWPARVGMVAYGVVYLLVAWLAAQLALGDPEGSASGKGALHEVAQQPLGAVLLWFVAAGLAALTVWEACQVVGGHRAEEGVRRWGARAASAGRGIVFAMLAVLAVRTVLGDSGGSGGGANGFTAKVLGWPLGPALVVAIGVGIACVGVFSAVKGLTDRWRKGLEAEGQSGNSGRFAEVMARVGYLSRALAFLVIAGLFGWAGATHDAGKSGGLDQAIMRFRDEPFGPWVILLVSVGLGCYGVFHVYRAWYLRGS